MLCRRLAVLMTALFLLLFSAQAEQQGSWQLDWFEDDDIVYAEICLTEGYAVLALSPVQPVTEVALTYLSGFDCSESTILWEADELLPGQVLKIHTDLPDGIPNLLISCLNADGEAESWAITDSGEDGHLMLIPASYVYGFYGDESYDDN